jgi:hypothetical protein
VDATDVAGREGVVGDQPRDRRDLEAAFLEEEAVLHDVVATLAPLQLAQGLLGGLGACVCLGGQGADAKQQEQRGGELENSAHVRISEIHQATGLHDGSRPGVGSRRVGAP